MPTGDKFEKKDKKNIKALKKFIKESYETTINILSLFNVNFFCRLTL